jgi:ferredoxin
MKILVNRQRCTGHARCNATAPKLFHLDADGYIDMDSFQVDPADEALAKRGARACPERALKAVDDDSDREATAPPP